MPYGSHSSSTLDNVSQHVSFSRKIKMKSFTSAFLVIANDYTQKANRMSSEETIIRCSFMNEITMNNKYPPTYENDRINKNTALPDLQSQRHCRINSTILADSNHSTSQWIYQLFHCMSCFGYECHIF